MQPGTFPVLLLTDTSVKPLPEVKALPAGIFGHWVLFHPEVAKWLAVWDESTSFFPLARQRTPTPPTLLT